MPKRRAQKVSAMGMRISAFSERALNRRSASSGVSTPMLMEKPLRSGTQSGGAWIYANEARRYVLEEGQYVASLELPGMATLAAASTP